MDPQLFELLRDRFDKQDQMLEEIRDTLKDHAKKDETYWRKLDIQEGQIALLKLIIGVIGTVGGAIGLWSWVGSKAGIMGV